MLINLFLNNLIGFFFINLNRNIRTISMKSQKNQCNSQPMGKLILKNHPFKQDFQNKYKNKFIYSNVDLHSHKKIQATNVNSSCKHISFRPSFKLSYQNSFAIQKQLSNQQQIQSTQKYSNDINQKQRKCFLLHQYQRSLQTDSQTSNEIDQKNNKQYGCPWKSQENKNIFLPKKNNLCFKETIQGSERSSRCLKDNVKNIKLSYQNTKYSGQNIKTNNVSINQAQVDSQSMKSQTSQQSIPQVRFKKTIFKAPQFIKNKNEVSQRKQVSLRKHSSSHNRLKSMPKSFKALQPTCLKKNSNLQKNQQKLKEQKIYKKKPFVSAQKRKTDQSSSKVFKAFFKTKSLKVNQNISSNYQKGRELSLRVFNIQNKLIYANLKILKILAQSRPSCTYLVIEKRTGFLYCLKKTQIKLVQEDNKINSAFQSNLNSLIRQSKIGMSLEHPFLIKTYCTLFDEENIFQLMQFVEGSNLQKLNRRRKKNQSALQMKTQNGIHPIKAIKQILSELLEAIIYLHDRKIVHRDLKPANIFISNKHAFKIDDFGCSIYSQPNDFVGTLDYVAPQIMLHQPHGTPVDMWAIGCIAYELYVGKPPFFHPKRNDTIQQIVYGDYDIKKIQEKNLRDLISKLLLKNPKKRLTAKEAYNHIFFQQNKHNKNQISS